MLPEAERAERNRARCRAYYASNRERGLQRAREQRASDPEGIKAYKDAWYERNHARLEAKRHSRTEEERARIASRMSAWKKQNKDRVRALNKAREALKAQRTPAWADKAEIRRFYAERPKGHHVDHTIPLKNDLVSGLHVVANLCYRPAIENLRKKNRFVPGEQDAGG